MNNDKFGVAAYNRVFNQFSSNGTMSFYEFIQAMELVISHLFPQEFQTNKLQIMSKIISELKQQNITLINEKLKKHSTNGKSKNEVVDIKEEKVKKKRRILVNTNAARGELSLL